LKELIDLDVQLVHCYLAMAVLRGFDMALFVLRQCTDEASLEAAEAAFISVHDATNMLHGLNCKIEPRRDSNLSRSVRNYTCDI